MNKLTSQQQFYQSEYKEIGDKKRKLTNNVPKEIYIVHVQCCQNVVNTNEKFETRKEIISSNTKFVKFNSENV